MILEQLRRATSAAHRTLEDTVAIESRLKSTERYRDLLEQFFGLYAPLEDRLMSRPEWPLIGYDAGARRKTPWLQQDLEALGLGRTEQTALPRCEPAPARESTACALGRLYVLEGSTLGGRQISHLLDGSGIPENARRFFASYGSDIGSKWQAFLKVLSETCRNEDDRQEAVNGAIDTFGLFQHWFTRSHV